MARTWLSVTVELLGGRGEEFWPYPGRIFAVGPSHTFLDLADSIDTAFARWDRAHLSMFTFADRRTVTDQELGVDLAASVGGPLEVPLDMAKTRVARTLELGAEFQYTFDLGDGWTHRCVVGDEKIDPLDELGVRPDTPMPYWGWGALPDQYGRRWAGDDGGARVPKRPSSPHPMLLHSWPGNTGRKGLDMTAVRRAIASQDAAGLLEAVSGRDIDAALQQIGAGMPMLLAQRPGDSATLAVSVINRLTWRGYPGDRELAADLITELRGELPAGRVLPVGLDELSSLIEGDGAFAAGAYVDQRSGEVYPESASDPMEVGEDNAIDVDADPDRWIWVESTGSRDRWEDMAAFASERRDAGLRQRLERAIEGKGAFRRFREVVGDEGLIDEWRIYSTDRELGRARELLAERGIRVGGARSGPAPS